MASIRMLKKDINKLAFDLLQECFAYRHFPKTFRRIASMK